MITYKLEESEFLEGMGAMVLWPRNVILSAAIFFGSVFVVGIFLTFFSTSADMVAVGRGGISAAIVAVIATVVFRPIMFRRKYARNFKRLFEHREPTIITWAKEGITGPLGNAEITPWSRFSGWKQTHSTILLYTRTARGTGMHIIPKRAFPNSILLNEFIELVGHNVASPN